MLCGEPLHTLLLHTHQTAGEASADSLGPKNRTKSDFFGDFQTNNGVNLGKRSEFGQKSEKSDPLGDTALDSG